MRRIVSLVKLLFVPLWLLSQVPLSAGPALATVASCSASENLEETATSFIGRCCKASIRREFPSELLSNKRADIKSGTTATYKKAWKLLNDNRFKK